MLDETISNIKEVSYFWATICSDNKGTTKTPAEGEEWLGGPFASVLATQYYIKSLTNDDDLDEGNFNNSENSYKVFPNNFIERITFPFINAKVYFNKSMSFEDINKFRGFSKRYDIEPSITLVLGAGNFSSIPYLDVLYHLITRRSVILLKLNPVNDYLKPVFEKVFKNFIERGYIIVTNGNIIRKNKIRLIRDGIVVFNGKIKQLKRFKEDVNEVKNGYECGLSIEDFNDIKVGDIIESFEIKEIKRKL